MNCSICGRNTYIRGGGPACTGTRRDSHITEEIVNKVSIYLQKRTREDEAIIEATLVRMETSMSK